MNFSHACFIMYMYMHVGMHIHMQVDTCLRAHLICVLVGDIELPCMLHHVYDIHACVHGLDVCMDISMHICI